MTNTQAEQVAVITGASSGIGKELALSLANRGWTLALAARRLDRLNDLAQQCKAQGARDALVVATDVAVEPQVQALVQCAVDAFGRVDVMVNNAGYGIFARVHETSTQQMKDIMDVNFMGVFYGCKAVAPVMIAQGSGHIFNVSSVIGKRGSPFHGAYSATKFAVVGLSDSLRVEMKPFGVRVTTVCPALTQTEFFDQSRGGRAAKSSFVKFKSMMPARAVADKMAATIGHSRPEIVFTLGGKMLAMVAALSPRLADAMMKLYHDDLAKRLSKET